MTNYLLVMQGNPKDVGKAVVVDLAPDVESGRNMVHANGGGFIYDLDANRVVEVPNKRNTGAGYE